MTEKDIQWWALALYQLDKNRADQAEAYKLRSKAQSGYFSNVKGNPIFEELCKKAADAASARGSIRDWIIHNREACQHAALRCPRAFVQFCNIRDDTLKVPILKDFHVLTIRAMREEMRSVVLLPYGHGKSWLGSMIVPFMDWAEDPEFTEGRVYFNDGFCKYWARKVMYEIEYNEQMHMLFPWISKPLKPDARKGFEGHPNWQFWSVKGFAIAGKQVIGPSFEAMTMTAGNTGKRFWRPIADDWVNSDNSQSEEVQDKLWNNFHTSVETMGRVMPEWRSKYKTQTKVGTVGLVGTLFDRRDINFRLMAEYERKGRKMLRFDVFPHHYSEEQGEVLWPEERPFTWVMEQKETMGSKAFNARCRNLIQIDGNQAFKESDVDNAIELGGVWKYGEAPANTFVLVGFDPASGKRTRGSKFPAAIVLAFTKHGTIHFVEWGRWAVPMPAQCDKLATWARKYVCAVAVEDASQQTAYAHWMNQRHDDVRVISHVTNKNKRDWIQGVESWIPLFEAGKVVIHSQEAPAEALKIIREELVEWPQGRYTDLVMAAWIAKYQYMLYQKTQGDQVRTQAVPQYAQRRGLTTTVDLKRLKDAAWGMK